MLLGQKRQQEPVRDELNSRVLTWLGRPAMTVPRSPASASTPAFATSRDGIHMNLGNASAVHQDVDGQPAALDLAEEAGAGVGVGDVAGDHPDADRAQLRRQLCNLSSRRATNVTP